MKNLLILFFLATGLNSWSQVAINTDGTNADNSAMLDVKSTTKGALLPRMTSAERIAIAAPAAGLTVYDLTTQGYWYYNGSAWTILSNSKWTQNGNSIFNNNNGSVGIGTTGPSGKLHVKSTDGLLNLEGSSTTGTWVTLGNTSSRGKWYTLISTGSGNVEGPGKLLFTGGSYSYNVQRFIMTFDTLGNVGISTTSPHPSAVLDITSTSKGFLPPRMTTAERTSITSPAAGLMVYDQTTAGHWYYNGTAWANLSNSKWMTVGNNIFNNNTGNVGIGTNAPFGKLHIKSTDYGLLNLEGSSAIGTWLVMSNTTLGGKGYNIISTGMNNSEGSGKLLFTGGNSAFNLLRFIMTFDTLGNVGISTTSPHPSAVLDVTSSNKGFLPPRMTTALRDLISSPAAGLTIYNTSKNCNETYNGTSWVSNTHYIGESYGGGIVFYVYDNGQHGLIAATADQSTGIRWYGGSNTNTRALADGVGAGLKNTLIIISNQGTVDGNAFAATLCNEYSVTVGSVTYGDWYLPSKYELNLLYLQKNVVGGFSSGIYWNSCDYSSDMAKMQRFSDGNHGFSNKGVLNRVRAIRAF